MTVIGSEVARREPRKVKIVQILVCGSTRHFTTVITVKHSEKISLRAHTVYCPLAYDLLFR
jgi:hypothetical protein